MVTTRIYVYIHINTEVYASLHILYVKIIIIVLSVTIVHTVNDYYGLEKDAVAFHLTISLHIAKCFVTRYMYIYICTYVYTYIHTYVQELYFVL